MARLAAEFFAVSLASLAGFAVQLPLAYALDLGLAGICLAMTAGVTVSAAIVLTPRRSAVPVLTSP